MHISRNADTIELKTKQATATLGHQITIGDITIDGPGEYDVAGIAVHGFDNKGQTVYVIGAEDIHLCHVSGGSGMLSAEAKDQVGAIDIVIVPLTTQNSPAETLTFINSLEPSVIIPIGDEALVEGFVKQAGITTEMVQPYKITRSTLPVDEQRIVILKSSR